MAKRILITGAATGIGAEAAKQLSQGNQLILHYHTSKKEAEQLQDTLRLTAESVDIVQADISNDEGCIHLFESVNQRFTGLDVLVNNAGGMVERRSVRDLTWNHLLATFRLNVFSTMRLTGLCTGLLEAGHCACVVNITSIAMRHGAPSATAYGSAKAAIDSFTRGAANELAPGIRVNAIAPGIIDTRFHQRVTSESKMKQFKEATPLKRFGHPVDIARAVQFLVENEFMTGETIDCNGGLFMR